jgi:hypothetical protein
MNHKTRFIRYQDREADVDVEIADLVYNLWKLDLGTLNSCQDNVPAGFVGSNSRQLTMEQRLPVH